MALALLLLTFLFLKRHIQWVHHPYVRSDHRAAIFSDYTFTPGRLGFLVEMSSTPALSFMVLCLSYVFILSAFPHIICSHPHPCLFPTLLQSFFMLLLMHELCGFACCFVLYIHICVKRRVYIHICVKRRVCHSTRCQPLLQSETLLFVITQSYGA